MTCGVTVQLQQAQVLIIWCVRLPLHGRGIVRPDSGLEPANAWVHEEKCLVRMAKLFNNIDVLLIGFQVSIIIPLTVYVCTSTLLRTIWNLVLDLSPDSPETAWRILSSFCSYDTILANLIFGQIHNTLFTNVPEVGQGSFIFGMIRCLSLFQKGNFSFTHCW